MKAVFAVTVTDEGAVLIESGVGETMVSVAVVPPPEGAD